MAAMNEDPNLDTSYSRRLDRTPEKACSNLARLSDDDRNKIYGLRTAFRNTVNKLQRLEESNDEKDLMIERERQLRKNLEDKLMETKLVDMYGDPAVNEELHERLPRAAKERMYSVHSSPRGRRKKNKKGFRSDEELSLSDDEMRYSRKHNFSFPGAGMPPPIFGSPGYYGWPGPGMMYANPFTQHSTPHQPPQSSPGQVPPPFHGMPTPWTSNNNASPGGPAPPGSKAEEVDVIKAASMLSADSKERQLARLLHEIDLLKDQNRKISDELAQSIADCNKLKVENELRGVSADEQISSRVSVLIQEIYQKQKQRDQALMGRLKLANEERDRAMAMVKAVKDGQSLSDMMSDDEDPHHSQSKSAMMSKLDVEHKTGELLDAIHSNTQRSRTHHSQRLKAMTAEKDAAEQKVRQLEMELLRLQREVDEITPIQDEYVKIQRQLSTTQEERDISLTRLRALEEENNNLKIYYGLHKSLSKEQSWKEQYNNSLNQMQQLIAQRDGNVLDAQKETNKLQELIQELTEERDLLSQDVEKLRASDTEHLRANERLQRHVSVLQKKLKKISQGEQGTV